MNLKDSRAAALKAARDIVEEARRTNRDLTPDEQANVKSRMDEVADLDRKLEGKALVDSVMALGGPAETHTEEEAPTSGAKSLGEHFAKSVGEDGFSRLKSIGGYTVSAPEFKAATDPLLESQYPQGALAFQTTQIDPNPVRTFRPGPVVADLLGSGTLGPNSNAVTYFLEGGLEGDFAFVGEGGQKPQIHLTDFTPQTDALRKIAAWWDTSDEMVEDLPFMQSEINNRGLYRLSMFEEAALLNGAGTGSTIKGLLNRSGIQTEAQAATGDSPADALFRAITKVQTATGMAADGIMINPADYQALRLSKDGNGQYFGGGYFQPQYGELGQTVAASQPLWGLKTVVTFAVPAKTAVVGSFAQAATVYRKGGIRVESTNSDLGKFTTNVITTRIEERVALAVRVPSAIVKVTLV